MYLGHAEDSHTAMPATELLLVSHTCMQENEPPLLLMIMSSPLTAVPTSWYQPLSYILQDKGGLYQLAGTCQTVSSQD
jgi:hypothetical protein